MIKVQVFSTEMFRKEQDINEHCSRVQHRYVHYRAGYL